jgi:hypothetical protein
MLEWQLNQAFLANNDGTSKTDDLDESVATSEKNNKDSLA